MYAIKLSPENIDKIMSLDTKAPDKAELLETYEKNKVIETLDYYYIPDYITKFGYATNSWAMIRSDVLTEDFDFTLSDTEVFEITNK